MPETDLKETDLEETDFKREIKDRCGKEQYFAGGED